jgi:hypothetical protein
VSATNLIGINIKRLYKKENKTMRPTCSLMENDNLEDAVGDGVILVAQTQWIMWKRINEINPDLLKR